MLYMGLQSLNIVNRLSVLPRKKKDGHTEISLQSIRTNEAFLYSLGGQMYSAQAHTYTYARVNLRYVLDSSKRISRHILNIVGSSHTTSCDILMEE